MSKDDQNNDDIEIIEPTDEEDENVDEKADETPVTTEPKTHHKAKKVHVVNSEEIKVNKFAKLRQAYLSKKKLTIPLSIVALVGLLILVPLTRYPLLGTVISRNYSIVVDDSQTGKPVSSAIVSVAGKIAKTDANGKARLKLKVGNNTLNINKKYYKDISTRVLVPLTGSSTYVYKVEATGRQVPVVIKDKVGGQVLANATITASGTEAKTDKDGKAIIVLPANKSKIEATVTAENFNVTKVTITVTDKEVSGNTFKIAPAGKLYFLSKLSGKIDVVKTDLDGSNRQTVLAGTGKEDDRGTVLLASRDWKYLALLAKRDSKPAKLYLIDTSNDKLTTMDEGDATFSLVGWSGHTFVYQVDRNNIDYDQPKRQALKSYDAGSSRLQSLDQTEVYQYYSGKFLINGVVVFIKNSSSGIYSVKIDGSDHKDLKTFADSYSYVNGVADGTNKILFNASNYPDNSYYIYEDGKLTAKSDIADEFAKYQQNPITYLISPSGGNTFWTEARDGKNALLIGDDNGANGKQIATLSELRQYGWYTDKYLLVSKKDSELHIMGREGGAPLKVTDYHKPDTIFYGYGGGYGGF